MAQSYDRRINLYINIDGKQVNNNVKSIRGELSHLVNAQNQMTIGSQEYVNQTRKIQSLKAVLKGHAETIGQIETPMQKAIGTAKSLLPALGFGAIAAGAKIAFDKVVASTDFLSTKWAVFTGGLKSGMNEFWRTIAVGDWSNFTENMKAAISVGREYETMLDDIEEKGRALQIIEAESRQRELALEEKLKNKTLSKADRLKAGQERIQMEDDLAKSRVKVAQESYDAELMITAQQSRISKERLMEVVSDLDSETKIKAKAYNEQLSIYESAVKKNEQAKAGLSRAGITNNPFAEEVANSKKILDSYPESIKIYAEAITGAGNTTDEQLNKMVDSYAGLLGAQNSAAENTKRVRTMVNSLLAGEGQEGKKNTSQAAIDPDNAKIASDALELAFKEQQLFLKDKYIGEETLQKEYHARMLANELAYIMAKQELATDDGTYLDLQSQYIDKQREYTAAIKETVPEILLTREGIENLNSRLLEQSKLLGNATQKQVEGTEAQKTATANQIQQADTIKMVGDVMTDYVTGALDGSIDGFQSFGDTLILMSLQILKQMVPIWSAQILGLSLASPESVATWGAAGMAKYALITGLMYAGIAAVEGAVKSGINKKREATTKHAAGGFTHGETTYIAGEAGQEWIAPYWQTTHPVTAPIIAGLEDIRRNPITVRSSMKRMFAEGGFTKDANFLISKTPGSFLASIQGYSPADGMQNELLQKIAIALDNRTTSGSGPREFPSQNNGDKDLIKVLEDNTQAMKMNSEATASLMKNGVQFPIVAFKKRYEGVSGLIDQTGMGGFKKK